jgi:hypothetical protein
MPTLGKSAFRYMERKKLIDTMRSPAPKYSVVSNRIHSYPLDPPGTQQSGPTGPRERSHNSK